MKKRGVELVLEENGGRISERGLSLGKNGVWFEVMAAKFFFKKC
jgi:hypothetical protein